MFAALGRFTVRFRWLIIAGWIVVTIVLLGGLPSLSSVEKSTNSQFLPSNAASVQAGRLAQPFSSSARSSRDVRGRVDAAAHALTRPTTPPSTAPSRPCARSRG